MARKKAPENRLSEDQLQAFDLYVKAWQERLGLNDWRVERGGTKKSRNMAEASISFPDRLAVYSVGDFGATAISADSIESTALHELLHVLLFSLTNQVEIELTGEALESEEHRVINVLEKLLLAQRITMPIKETA